MKLKAAILEAMATDQLRQCAEDFDVEVADRRKRDVLIAALRRKRSIRESALLEYLSEVEVKEVCEALEVPAKGRRAALIERLLAELCPESNSTSVISGQPANVQEEADSLAETDGDSSSPGVKSYTIRLSPDSNLDEMREVMRADAECAVDARKAATPNQTIQDRSSLMEKITADSAEAQSADIVTNNIDQLKDLFPEAFTEGRIDFDVLKQLLGSNVDEREEKYGLNWHGKRRARQLALTTSTGTLRPCPEDSVDWDTTQNLMIEGDNLEVLKLLQKSYAGKVKLIYIDPPYNTGKDFVYPDNFQDSIKNYLELTGQVEGGRKISSNTEASGRFHTDWLNMMYPRLKLARNLLQECGTIFISCDNSEIQHLKMQLSDIFGEENVIGTIANVNNPKGRSDDRFIATSHEYIIVVAKNAEATQWGGFEPETKVIKRYNKTDEVGLSYREIDLRKTGDSDRRIDRPDMFYYFYFSPASSGLRVSKLRDAVTGDEVEIFPQREDGVEGRWRWGLETAKQGLNGLLARFMPNRKIWGVFERDYLEGRSLIKPTSSWTFKEVNSERGSEQFVDLGFPKEAFPRPKPLGTIERVLDIGAQLTTNPEIVLDFFAGSGTSAHAVMSRNVIDNGNRRYVLVQLPEPLDPESSEQLVASNFCDEIGRDRTISELTKERLRRAGNSIKAENPMFSGDTGFRVYKLDRSNIRAWNPSDDLEQDLLDSAEHIVAGRSERDILTEILLKLGLDLCVPIETRQTAGKSVHAIGGGVLFACLDTRVSVDDAEPLALGIVDWHQQLAPAGDSACIFRDSAFADDVAKTNLAAILQQHGIANVRSL